MDPEIGNATEVVIVRFVLVRNEWQGQTLDKLREGEGGGREGEREGGR